MNEKVNFDYLSESENEKNIQSSRDRSDFKLPCDMKTFWKSMDEKFFSFKEFCDPNEINHKILSQSKYDINTDSVFTKIGFPKSINQFIGKSQDLYLRKNNPTQIEKIFGMNLYIDKYDYLLNNTNNDEIEKEIDCLAEKLNEIEENKIKIINFFVDILNKETENSSSDLKKINLKDSIVKNIRLQNITNQIYTLQMKQLAESVMNIKKCVKKDDFLLIFDPSEKIDHIILEEIDYRKFIRYRDTLNSTSIYDLFQEKIHSYYKISSNGNNKGNRKPRQRGLNYKKKNRKIKEIKSNKSKKSKLNDDEFQIANNISINYNICHHCKQRKPLEVLTKCKASDCAKLEAPSKHFVINNTTVFRKNKNFIITNYMGDPREILENYLLKKSHYICNRYFCNLCLKGSYDWNLEILKEKKDWMCPCCMGNCFCSRCLRYDQILKLIALFVSLEGDMNDLYEYLINKSFILERLSRNLILNKIFIIKNESNIKLNKIIKENLKFTKEDNQTLDKTLSTTIKYLENLLGIRDYFNIQLQNTNIERIITRQCLNLDKIKINQISNYNEKIIKETKQNLKENQIQANNHMNIKAIINEKKESENVSPKSRRNINNLSNGYNMNNIKIDNNHNNINIFADRNFSINANENTFKKPHNFNDNSKREKFNTDLITNGNQKLNFNFNFNFPSQEYTKLLKRKRHFTDKKNKNFNVNLNLNVNLNPIPDSNIRNNNNNMSSNSIVKLRNIDLLNPNSVVNLTKNLSNNLKINETNVPHTDKNFFKQDYKTDFESKLKHPNNISPPENKIKENLRNRSAKDLLRPSFSNKYLGENTIQQIDLEKKESNELDNVSSSYNEIQQDKIFKNILNKIEEKNPNLQENKIIENFDFDFRLLNVSRLNQNDEYIENKTLQNKNNLDSFSLRKSSVQDKLIKLAKRIQKKNAKYSRIKRNLENY